ncbi:hypothetical protein FB451DRAFT_1417214 [Mycena latifolia]|nr:hypothetical protein FB451DRAFT_1417214 [Mycena latifolia]
MTHGAGGTWQGYLSFPPVGAPAPPDCGTDSASYTTCEDHGNKDDLGARAAYGTVTFQVAY